MKIFNSTKQNILEKNEVTPGVGYPSTLDGKRGYTVYDEKGKGKFTEYPNQPKPKEVTPGVGYPSTLRGKRGYTVYDEKGKGKFTEYPNQPAPAPATPAAPAAPTPPTAAPATPARPAAAPAAPSRPSSSATASTADKIKGGMETWRQQKAAGDLESATKTGKSVWALANPKLAAAAAERERIRGTAQSDNPLLDKMGLRSKMSVTPTVQAPAVKDLGLGQQSLSQNKFAGQASKPKATPTPATSTKTDRPQRARTGFGEEYDAYDLVLEYILSEGHADTLSEAHYVMMQMSSDYIQSIVENRGMSYSGGKPGPSGDGSRPPGIKGGKTYQMPGFSDDSKKPKVKGV
jgi:hypothetical protein